jgi:hypothetical protein
MEMLTQSLHFVECRVLVGGEHFRLAAASPCHVRKLLVQLSVLWGLCFSSETSPGSALAWLERQLRSRPIWRCSVSGLAWPHSLACGGLTGFKALWCCPGWLFPRPSQPEAFQVAWRGTACSYLPSKAVTPFL